MRYTAVACIAAALFLGALLPWPDGLRADEEAERPTPGIDWRTDLEAAREEAKASKRPLWVTFRCVP